MTNDTAIRLPANEQGVSRAELAVWERHKANLSNPNARTRRNAWDAMAKLESAWDEARDRGWVAQAIGETLALARARREEVAVAGDGRVTLSTRSGLLSAIRSGHLDGLPWSRERLQNLALMYRSALEVEQAQATPRREAGPRTPSRPSGPQHALLHAGEVLRTLRTSQPLRARVLLDLVCGLDMALKPAALVLGIDKTTAHKVFQRAMVLAADNWDGRGRSTAPTRSALEEVRGAIERTASRWS